MSPELFFPFFLLGAYLYMKNVKFLRSFFTNFLSRNEMTFEPSDNLFPPTQSVAEKGDVESLNWYAGLQPILLTLPEGRHVTALNWLSIFDHKMRVFICFIELNDN